MRILFTCQPAYSHFYPLVPIARALAAGGDSVAFVSSRTFAERIERMGFAAFPAGLDWLESEAAKAFPELRGIPLEQQSNHLSEAFANAAAERMIPDLLEIVRSWKPDVIVRETWEMAGCLVGERLGVPHATVNVGVFLPLELLAKSIGRHLQRHRRRLGLAPDYGLQFLYSHLYLHSVPEEYQPLPPLPTAHAIRPLLFDEAGAERQLDAELLRPTTRPRVFVTLGTVFTRIAGAFERIIGELRDEPIELVVAVSRDRRVEDFGPQPENVHLRPFVPLTLIREHCAVIVSHGGFSTTMSTLSGGVPQVLVPFISEQMLQAQRCDELKVGIAVYPAVLEPGAVRAALRGVLADPSYAANARKIKAAIEKMPGAEHAAELVRSLARARTERPLLAEAVSL